MRKLTFAFARQLTLLTAVGLVVAACGADVDMTTSPTAACETDPAACGADVDTTTSPTPACETDPAPWLERDHALSAGCYVLSEFPAGITYELPEVEPPGEWTSCSPSPTEQAACYWPDGPDSDIDDAGAVTFQIVDNVVADPCSDQDTAELLNPPVGPSVDYLVEAISNLEGYEATDPVDITVSGFDGKEFMLTAPDTEGCNATWATADRTTGMGANEINLLRIVDVDGVRVVITSAYHPETTEAAVAALQQVMDSVQIEP